MSHAPTSEPAAAGAAEPDDGQLKVTERIQAGPGPGRGPFGGGMVGQKASHFAPSAVTPGTAGHSSRWTLPPSG